MGDDDHIALSLSYDERLNYAMQQNAIPAVRLLQVENRSDAPLDDVLVRLTTSPELSEPFEARLDRLAPGALWSVEGVRALRLLGHRLGDVRERVRGSLDVELKTNGRTVRRGWDVEVLAHNEWSGVRSLPELLAAFVQPNCPAIAALLPSVGDALGAATGIPSLDGYQRRDAERVLLMAEALYRAVHAEGITYANPPASFETTGQKVRLPDELLRTKLGTCLDLALLFASGLEQMGLHALVAIIEGHAFCGVWLTETCFAEGYCDDAAQLDKRQNLEELVMFEATAAVRGARPIPFTEAIDRARPYLEEAERFHFAVCVSGARARRIRPLPTAGEVIAAAAAEVQALPESALPSLRKPRSRPGTPGRDDATAAVTVPERVRRWQTRLLDLSLRNPLLNHRETARVLPLMAHDLGSLEDALAEGTRFVVEPRPDADPRDAAVHQAQTGEDMLGVILRHDQGKGVLRSTLPRAEHEKRATSIYRDARAALEETGANTLFIAIGMLRWYESESSQQERSAPLVLVPLEVTRRSAGKLPEFRRADDETIFNVTLAEKLATDFGIVIEGIDPLPEDDAGVDITAVLTSVERAVLDQRRWTVRREASIGLFSFRKFMMWRDLSSFIDRLMDSPVVRHLVEASGTAYGDGAFPAPERLDDERSAAETFCPLDADSSQLVAIHAAADGKDFVLEGPPGTGKSQTITNLIAHNLALGRTVLFVSEKRAALDVVHRRLGSVGLGAFCLELHSNKAQKSAVLAQLGQTLHQAAEAPPGQWADLASRLERRRAELNQYARALHDVHPSGRSVFAATSHLVTLRDAPSLEIGPSVWTGLSSARVTALRDTVAAFARLAEEAERDDLRKVWEHVAVANLEPALPRRVRDAADACLRAVDAMGAARDEVVARLELPPAPWTRTRLARLSALGEALLEADELPRAVVEEPAWTALSEQLVAWAGVAARREALQQGLAERYDLDALMALDLDGLHRRFARWAGAFVVLAFLMLFFARRAVRGAVRAPAQPADEAVRDHLRQAIELRRSHGELEGFRPEAERVLGALWRGGQIAANDLRRIRDGADTVRAASATLVARPEEAAPLRSRLAAIAEDRSLLAPGGELSAALSVMVSAWSRLRDALTELEAVLGLTSTAFEAADAELLDAVRRRAERWSSEPEGVRTWARLNHQRGAMEEAGLGALAAAHASGQLPAASLEAAFERSLWEPWVQQVIRDNDMLRSWHSAEHERRIADFRALDQEMRDLSAALVRARLAERVPDPRALGAKGSELGVLQREMKKKRRHLPVRRLFQQIPTLVPRLKPCVLMSPLSVAQFLEPTHRFDLVVFDEASQIPPWDAIGAIARGTQVIVVGDSKQLPPTSFFGRVEDEGDTEDDLAELESILDEMVAAQVPRRYLRWHYRSRHEELIAFSNYHYYGNELLVFPAPVAESARLGVRLEQVADGIYDRGGARNNLVEANRLVAELVRRLRDESEAHRSIGVVTFSRAQQVLIEDLLDAERRRDPSLERFFGDEVVEPVFVKNLETVQGDERDVILFGVGYGRDRHGKLSMSFGPINNDGGERRLNVAITRAREQVVVYSSLRSSDIDLTRTRAVGALHLKTFLDYADRGARAIAEATQGHGGPTESPLEDAVLGALEAEGWRVVPQVGVAGYRVDLGVIHPDRPGDFLLGVECDGAAYHSAKTARDRDRLRQAVLESLGWRIHRVWSSDWWEDPKRTLRRLLEALEGALAAPPKHALAGANAAAPAAHAVTPTPPPLAPLEPEPRDRTTALEQAGGEPYVAARTDTLKSFAGGIDAPGANAHLGRFVGLIVRGEAPIAVTLVGERLKDCMQVQRVTRRVQETLVACAERLAGVVVSDDFLWDAQTPPASYRAFRFSDPSAAPPRKPEQIPVEEICNAARGLVEVHGAWGADELRTELARVFGFGSTGKKVAARMDEALDRLVVSGALVRDGERLRAP